MQLKFKKWQLRALQKLAFPCIVLPRGKLHLGTQNHGLPWKTLGSELLPPVFALQLVCDLKQVVLLLCQL